jgi:hypothetical protein
MSSPPHNSAPSPLSPAVAGLPCRAPLEVLRPAAGDNAPAATAAWRGPPDETLAAPTYDVIPFTDDAPAHAAHAAVDPTGLILLPGGSGERPRKHCYTAVEEPTGGRAGLAGRVIGRGA